MKWHATLAPTSVVVLLLLSRAPTAAWAQRAETDIPVAQAAPVVPAEPPAAAELPGPTDPPAWSQGYVVITPGPQYARSGLAAALRGRHYRDLWATPIRVPVLDLHRFAGGLVPISAHTGSQTKSLLLQGADGRRYQFRAVDKDPTASLRPEIRGSAYGRELRDGVSASFPAAPLVANPLLGSAGVLTTSNTLALMPDDPALGSFRSDFKNVLGLIEARPGTEVDASTSEPVKVISPTRLFERIDASPNDLVDARAFLRARLMDMLMGDRDRHRDQFRWTTIGGAGHPRIWQPISRDHDEAFVQLDGPGLDIARLYYPPLVTFRAEYPAHFRLNWHAREVDRRFLVGLDRGTWDSVATELQRTLTDSTIEAAVRHMPAEMYPVGGERLARVLRARRDGLEHEALSYYAFLAHEVEIRATDAPEVAELTRVDAHHLDLAIRARGEAEPYFARRFDDRETQEIRLKMWGGDDQVIVRGAATPHIRLKIVGGAGNDDFADSTRSARPRFYDDQGQNTAEGARHVAINTKPYREWVGSDTDRYPPREWGTWYRPAPWLGMSSDLGFFVGGGFERTEYGFRRAPFASDIRLRVGYSTGAHSPIADLAAEFHPENSSHFWRLHLLASGIETLNYYGQGNDTPNLATGTFYRVRQDRYAVEPALVLPVGRHADLSIGAFARYTHTGDNEGRFLESIQDTLLGWRNLGEVGGRLGFDFDTRDRPVNPLHGVHLAVSGELHPAVWDVDSTYGSARAEATAFVSAKAPLIPTLALRAGGRRVWGAYPFFESAFIGGPSTLVGFHSNRFAGDASLYGGALLRLTMGRAFLPLPATWGLFGTADAARVYLDGASTGGWHVGGGGGIWLAFLDGSNALSLGVNTSKEGTLLQAGTAFGF